MKKWLPAIAVLIFGLHSCQDKSAEASARWDEVIDIHNEVMPKMGAIHQTSKALNDLVAMADSLSLSGADQEEIAAQLQALQAADDAMMDWMNNFQQLERLQREKSHQEVMDYLNTEEIRIKEVKTAMESSIAKGQDLLQQLTTPTKE
ncbi:MAG: hypothetical protein KDC44_20745 [Phaeodactylibacter sp.]|nr:hypothetical protein [Phaeodactylibacter sp.]